MGGECLCLWGLSASYCANDGEDPGACGRLCLHSAEGKERWVRVREAKASVDSRPPGSGCCACLLSPAGLLLNHSLPLQPRSGTHCQVGLFWMGLAHGVIWGCRQDPNAVKTAGVENRKPFILATERNRKYPILNTLNH